MTDTIRRAGDGVAVVCDVTDAKSLQALYHTAAETYGDIHVVVVNAGSGSHKFADIDPDEWRQVINLNLAAMEQVARHSASTQSRWRKELLWAQA